MFLLCCFNNFFYEGGFNNKKCFTLDLEFNNLFELFFFILLFSLEFLLMLVILINPMEGNLIVMFISILSIQLLIIDFIF